ncbi:mrr restriction system protein [Photobacterium leiognathi lrivu.4.1]|uniref:Mrr restriction system protein n=1 Tax=Photobacterium leiognathi lrivu.4.1 TaxID=1248232 RepID=A0A0U1P586_PHOLE|nr:restriction endonuclease [Photobacterium leiognathi]GAD29827.1 mrr restriction system protein [Photobacterium leiognathi lrivu.4.1]
MSIPKHNEIRFAALTLLSNGQTMKSKEFVAPLKEHYQLSNDEVNQMYDSGNGPVFYDRITWALSFLNANGLVDKPKRGVYQINDNGRAILARQDAQSFLYSAQRERKPSVEAEVVDETDKTPQELLSASFDEIKQSIYDDILDTVIRKSPRAFEHLVVRLLEKMGYGGQVVAAGHVTQASNDGGIDGIIKEDVLGLGRIHIQAKRYDINNTVGREEIQKFVGALAVAQSNKGVFITTSSYSKSAKEYANNLNGSTALVLIDGQQLAKYIYDYNLGMQIEQVIEIKKMDSDFWDTMSDA